jgi:hypothetical protein
MACRSWLCTRLRHICKQVCGTVGTARYQTFEEFLASEKENSCELCLRNLQTKSMQLREAAAWAKKQAKWARYDARQEASAARPSAPPPAFSFQNPDVIAAVRAPKARKRGRTAGTRSVHDAGGAAPATPSQLPLHNEAAASAGPLMQAVPSAKRVCGADRGSSLVTGTSATGTAVAALQLYCLFQALLFGPERHGHRAAESETSHTAAVRIWQQCLDGPQLAAMAPGDPVQLTDEGTQALATGQCFRRQLMQTIPLQDLMDGVWTGLVGPDGGPVIGKHLPEVFVRHKLGWADAAGALLEWLSPRQAGFAIAFEGAQELVGQNGRATGLFAHIVNYFDLSNKARASADWLESL